MAAKAKKKATSKTVPGRAAKPVRRTPRGPRKARSSRNPSTVERAILPAFLSLCILICISVFAYLGYEKAADSNFFEVAAVDVRGVARASSGEIEEIVRSQAEKTGVWNADLVEMKIRVEKIPYVETASVSRILPNGIRVVVFEREPAARVRVGEQEFLMDGHGVMLEAVSEPEPELPFVMLGWDQERSEAADTENAERMKAYRAMLHEWREIGVADRVRQVDVSDLREPRAIIEDSGQPVSIAVGRSNFGENLKNGIRAIVGKGDTFGAVNLVGGNMRLEARKAAASAEGK
ncbi:MAG: FtsQ-type POTRA domain-containing protein [Blastocatellia bacterium]|nr:FtsQ-type POTRA domain-containing protein [Blastocatellia bacterium]